MGPAGRRGLAVVALALAAGCPPVGPREVTGGKRDTPAVKSALQLLAEPGAPRIVAAERSGQGSRLVLIDERGATVRPLTGEPADGSIDVTPAWSPDGNWVLFASSRDRPSTSELSLWIVPVFAEGGAVRLTAGPGLDMTPTWSPDGESIAWASTRGGAGFDIWVAKFDPGGVGPPRLSKPIPVTSDASAEETMPTWSRQSIAWVRSADGASDVVAQFFDQPNHRTRGKPDSYPGHTGASWPRRPHGISGWLATSRRSATTADLVLASASGRDAPPGSQDPSQPRVFASDLGDESAPAFSSDNRFLFATSVARTADGSPLWSSIVFLDLTEDPPKLRALYDKAPQPRLGVDLAPVPLDADVLLGAPDYREGLKQVLTALGFKAE